MLEARKQAHTQQKRGPVFCRRLKNGNRDRLLHEFVVEINRDKSHMVRSRSYGDCCVQLVAEGLGALGAVNPEFHALYAALRVAAGFYSEQIRVRRGRVDLHP